jgi:multicomponent Na+:H+ antiporter subunit E
MDKNSDLAAKAVTFFILLGFWLLLSGYFDPFHITLGIVSSAAVAWISSQYLFAGGVHGLPGKIARSVRYIVWLISAIIMANLDVVYRVLHPSLPIDPGTVEFTTGIRSDYARTLLANSITLTPGTITLDVRGGTYVVHALTRQPAHETFVRDREMQKRVAHVFEEED